MRRKKEIVAAEDELFEKFLHVCRLIMKKRAKARGIKTSQDIRKSIFADEDNLFRKVGEEAFLPKDDFEWGMINGKLSALHWALGKEWNFLDESLWERRRYVMRSEWEIGEAENEFFERVWFGRNSKFVLNENGEPVLAPRFDVGMFELLVERYGEKSLIVADDFEWGVWSGKLSALRWILGDEWDFLDT